MAKTLGEILTSSGIISAEQLKKAALYSSQNNVPLGDAAMKLGYATEDQITFALSKNLAVPYASKENNILIPEKEQNLQMVINERFARENTVLPLFLEEGVLAVALNDPSNVFVIDNIKMMTGYDVQPFIGSKSQILTAIDSFYGGKDLIEEVVVGKEKAPEEEQFNDDVEVVVMEDKLDLDTAKESGSHYIKLVNAILKQAISERTSDIHLEMFDEMVSLRFRIDGSLYERLPPPKESVAAIISRIKILSKLDIAERRLPQDGSFGIKFQNRTIEIRVSVCPTVFGEKLVLRILDKGTSVLTVEKLGFEPKQKEDFLAAANAPHGLIFLTGPTGSGKTTTLNAVLTTIRTPEYNFMTLEDPVEYKLQGISQVQVKPQIGLTFAAGLRSFLRQDPDVILVGEVRDNETAEACLKAALTGHLVLSTLHTNDALGAVPRLIDMGMEPFLLSSSLELVAAQRLLRKLCPHCRRPVTQPQEIVDQALRESQLPKEEVAGWTFFEKVGCPKCSGTGYLGRLAIYEVFRISEEMRTIIYKTQDLIELKKASIKTGAWNLRASGWRKAVKGVTTVEEILSVTTTEE